MNCGLLCGDWWYGGYAGYCGGNAGNATIWFWLLFWLFILVGLPNTPFGYKFAFVFDILDIGGGLFIILILSLYDGFVNFVFIGAGFILLPEISDEFNEDMIYME